MSGYQKICTKCVYFAIHLIVTLVVYVKTAEHNPVIFTTH